MRSEDEIRERLGELRRCENRTEHPILSSGVQGQIVILKWVLGE